jgi:hypothetical protein
LLTSRQTLLSLESILGENTEVPLAATLPLLYLLQMLTLR